MTRVPPWLIAMFAGVVAAGAAGGAGANGLVALLAALVAALLVVRVQRAPPWTRAGRAAWRRSWVAWVQLVSALLGRGRQRWGSGGADDVRYVPPVHAGAAAMPDTHALGRVAVRCEVVTARLQVWHSTQTKRAYEVPSERGLAGAAPGDTADLVFEAGRPRVIERELN